MLNDEDVLVLLCYGIAAQAELPIEEKNYNQGAVLPEVNGRAVPWPSDIASFGKG